MKLRKALFQSITPKSTFTDFSFSHRFANSVVGLVLATPGEYINYREVALRVDEICRHSVLDVD